MSINKNPFIVDSHCHLNYEGLNHRVDEVIANAHKAGVGLMQTICTKLSEFEDIYKIAENNPSVYASVGIHPHEADGHKTEHGSQNTENPLFSLRKQGSSDSSNEINQIKTNAEQLDPRLRGEDKFLGNNDKLMNKILEYASRPKTIGIGETGLDYYYEHSSKESQQKSFLIHMESASKSGLPIIIHTRDAEEDTYRMMKDFVSNNKLKGLLHCFTGTADLAKKALDMGFYISISGIITFKNANELRDVVKNVVPLDRLLVETDSPFLAPMPFRGKTCEPAYTRNTAEFIAELKGISLEELATATTNNFLRLFDKVKIQQ
jgi:TatD DNase family protein